MKSITGAPTARVIGSLLSNLLAALMGTFIAQSPFFRIIAFFPPYRAAMVRADFVIAFVAFGVGFAVYARWRPELSKWLWLAGICWYLPRTILKLSGDHSSEASSVFGGSPDPTYADILAWAEFTIPCLRLVFYSIGAYCCSRLLSWIRASRDSVARASQAELECGRVLEPGSGRD
jgi:hypothetical protein